MCVITDDLKGAGFCTLPQSSAGFSQPLPSVDGSTGSTVYLPGSANLFLIKASFGAEQVTPGTSSCCSIVQRFKIKQVATFSETPTPFGRLTLFSSSMAICSSLIFLSSSRFSLVHSSRTRSLGYWKIFMEKHKKHHLNTQLC